METTIPNVPATAEAGLRVVLMDGTCRDLWLDQDEVHADMAADLRVTMEISRRGAELHAAVRNRGRHHFKAAAIDPAGAEPFYFKGIYLALKPTYARQWFERDTKALFDWNGFNVLELCGPSHVKSPNGFFPLSTREHMLAGGESISWTFDQSPSDTRFFQTAHVECLDYFLDSVKRPDAAQFGDLFTHFMQSFDNDAPAGVWGLRWYRHNFHQHHAYGNVRQARGPFDGGAMPWGEGCSNNHYDLVLACLRAWRFRHRALAGIKGYAQGELDSASIIGRWQADHGFVDSDPGVTTHRPGWLNGYANHVWHFEKTQMKTQDATGSPSYGHVGDYRFPELSHQWDAGMFFLALLNSQPNFRRVADMRAGCLYHMTDDTIWRGYYGLRPAAWHLRNLFAAHVTEIAQSGITTGPRMDDQSFAKKTLWSDKAEGFLRHVFGIIGNAQEPPDYANPTLQIPWQTAQFLYWLSRWQRIKVGSAWVQRGIELGRFLVDNHLDTFQNAHGTWSRLALYSYANGSKVWCVPWSTTLALPLLAALDAVTPSNEFTERLETMRRTALNAPFANAANIGDPNKPAQETDWRCSAFSTSLTKAVGQVILGTPEKALLGMDL